MTLILDKLLSCQENSLDTYHPPSTGTD